MAQRLRNRKEDFPDEGRSEKSFESSSNELFGFMLMMNEERKQEREAERQRQEPKTQRRVEQDQHVHDLLSTVWQRQEKIRKLTQEFAYVIQTFPGRPDISTHRITTEVQPI